MTLDLGTDNYDKDLIQSTLYNQLEKYHKIGSYSAKTDGFTFRDFGGELPHQIGLGRSALPGQAFRSHNRTAFLVVEHHGTDTRV